MGRERRPPGVARWVVADPVSVAGYELLAGVKGERSTAVEECVEFSGPVELVGFEPGVESGDRDPSEAAGSAGSACSDSGVAGESSFGEDAFVDEDESQPRISHGGVYSGSVYVCIP